MVHSDVLRLKLKKRNNLLLKLAASSWGADVPTLRTATLALVFFSVAEYCSTVWINNTYVSKIDAQFIYLLLKLRETHRQ